MARPSTYNFDLCKKICDEIADGDNIKNILKSNDDYPDWSAFRRWKNENEELRTLYVSSQTDKAMALESEIDELRVELKEKKIDANTYNVLVQTLKWKMAKFYPKVFGDATKLTIDGNLKVETTDYKSYTTEDLEAIEKISEKYKTKEK